MAQLTRPADVTNTDGSERDLLGKVALVTGGSRNLGRACVLEFARRGADVVIASRGSEETAATVAAACDRHGVRAVTVQFDLADAAEVEQAVRAAEAQLGGIDVYVACAAIRPRQSWAEVTPDDWDHVLQVNLSSAFYLAKAIVPGMVERGWGRVIHIAGADGWVGYRDRVHNVAAKYGLHGLTKGLALELAEHGVTVNTVTPGAFDTVRRSEDFPNWDAVERAKSIPVQRLGSPDELAALCAFLASERAAYITGQVVHINGGQFLF